MGEAPRPRLSSLYAKITPVGDRSATAHQASTGQLGDALTPYEAILLVSFGGPEKPEDVLPFLENVTRGRGIPRERLVEVGEHYHAFGGRSPINDQNRAFIAAVEEDLRSS